MSLKEKLAAFFKTNKEKEAEKIWRALTGEPDPDFLDKYFNDVMDGKEVDDQKFEEYIQYKVKKALNEMNKCPRGQTD